VLLGMSLSGLFGVISGMGGMTACSVSMMCRLLPTVVMLRCFFGRTAAARSAALPISCRVMRLVKPEIAAAWKAYCG
jgi:hypothetical protein